MAIDNEKGNEVSFLITINKENRQLNIDKDKFSFRFSPKNYEWYIKGQIFYAIDSGKQVSKQEIDSEYIEHLFKRVNYDVEKIKNILEGHYICVIKNTTSIKIFGDKFNRMSLFFVENKSHIYMDTKISQNMLAISGPQLGTLSVVSFMLIGYGHGGTSMFEGIKRIPYETYLDYDISKGEVKLVNIFSPQQIEEYGNEKLGEFEDLFVDSIRHRMSKKTNWVLSSGGWDATLIIDSLLKLTPKEKVKSAIFEMRLKDGRVLNKYEMIKAEAIAKHYGIEHYSYTHNNKDKGNIDAYRKHIRVLIEKNLLNYPLFHFGMVDFIKQIEPEVDTIFNGEIADSFQNYGFSQYLSMHSGIHAFDEYADKMKTYLYGPSFFKEVRGNSFRNNKIYEIFKNMNKAVAFNDDEGGIMNYMLSFIYSPSRLPFTLPYNNSIIDNGLMIKFFKDVWEQAFKIYAGYISESNIYSIWNALYADFHFKGALVPIAIESIELNDITASFPFFDIRLAAFFAKMPESWGRGLNFNHVKYPEKMMAKLSNSFPLEIVNADSPHSYIFEDKDVTIDPWYEHFFNSSLTEYFKDIMSNENPCYFLEIEGFNQHYISHIVNNFLNGKVTYMDVPALSRICLLKSMLIELKNIQ